MKPILTLALLLATAPVIVPAMAQERTAGGTLETQMTWSALSTKIGALDTQVSSTIGRMNQVVTCGKKGMLYAPGHTDSKGVIDSDSDGCLSVAGGGAAPTDYCYARKAERWQTPHCDKDYYVKAGIKATDNNWDGYSSVCCYTKPGKDPRIEADKAGFIAKTPMIVPSSVGLSYNAIATACAAKPSTYAQNRVSCPPADVLP